MADEPARVDDADGLFDLPVGDFVAARDDLARRLKASGHDAEASRVKALRRPTLAAWAVNQVVRHDPGTWEAVTSAGAAARRAQRRALSGVADSGLREAGARRRRAIEDALAAAVRHLDAAGARPDGHLDDVAATLEAATGDAGVAEQVGAGLLSGAVAAPDGMAGLAALMSVPAGEGVEVPDGDDGDDPVAERRRAAIREVEAARARSDTQARAARQARAEADELATAASRAEEHAEKARETAEHAAEEAAAAIRRATDAAQAAEEAEAAAAAAEQAARSARQALDDLA